MTTRVSSRLLALGTLWGLLLAVVPALVMTSPYRLTGMLVGALFCAVLSGCIGTLVAGRRAARSIEKEARPEEGHKRSKVLARVRIGASQGLVGGGIAALLFWVLMALTASGFTLLNPVEISALMSPRVFVGSFLVALSVFAYALVGGLLLGPVFGMLVNRIVRTDKEVGDNAGGKEDLVVH
jgi:MFS family permease